MLMVLMLNSGRGSQLQLRSKQVQISFIDSFAAFADPMDMAGMAQDVFKTIPSLTAYSELNQACIHKQRKRAIHCGKGNTHILDDVMQLFGIEVLVQLERCLEDQLSAASELQPSLFQKALKLSNILRQLILLRIICPLWRRGISSSGFC
jgi:hypothetical protein